MSKSRKRTFQKSKSMLYKDLLRSDPRMISKYSITFVDALARPAGFMGQSFGRGGDDATGAWASFDSLQVLEPALADSGEGL